MLFFKKNKSEGPVILCAPVSGKMIDLKDVPDPVFSSGTMGPGAGFQPEKGIICAPCDGKITMLAETLHAFGMETENGAEILIHVGLDTVELNGEGFKKLASEGKKVKRGTPIIEVDLDMMKEKGIVMTTPMVITNSEEYTITLHQCGNVNEGETEVLTCEKR